jgi:septum formation protein
MPLILASSSPRRRELLINAGIPFEVRTANISETRRDGESPLDYARRLAREKAETVAANNPDSAVLGADTIVLVDDHVLGKPADAEDAERMLRLLRGRSHQVLTAVCIIRDAKSDIREETTTVHFGEVTDEEISAYVQHGEPMDKAGAYAIQGMASRWIDRIEGDYFNVVGLPVALVYRMLRERGSI